jgi:predicted amino acid dehydrogenase
VAETVQVFRQIAVKTIVTEQFKSLVASELEKNTQQIGAELQQLEFRVRRLVADIEKRSTQLLSSDTQTQVKSVKDQGEQERTRLAQMKSEMETQGRYIADLPLDSQFTQFTLQSPVELGVGDSIFKKLEAGEIIIKDGVVQEIKV